MFIVKFRPCILFWLINPVHIIISHFSVLVLRTKKALELRKYFFSWIKKYRPTLFVNWRSYHDLLTCSEFIWFYIKNIVLILP
jgi:hypothetical protein